MGLLNLQTIPPTNLTDNAVELAGRYLPFRSWDGGVTPRVGAKAVS